MVRVWAGSFANKTRLLASVGIKRTSKNKRRRGKHKTKPFYAAKQARKQDRSERKNWTWAYQHRNHYLTMLGYGTYADYLASDLWKSIRASVLQRDRYQCHGCGRHAFQVHHRSYGREVLRGVNIDPLVAICRECHEQIELDHKGNKISLEATNARLCAIRNRRCNSASA